MRQPWGWATLLSELGVSRAGERRSPPGVTSRGLEGTHGPQAWGVRTGQEVLAEEAWGQGPFCLHSPEGRWRKQRFPGMMLS